MVSAQLAFGGLKTLQRWTNSGGIIIGEFSSRIKNSSTLYQIINVTLWNRDNKTMQQCS
jgi:hypothetical protein